MDDSIIGNVRGPATCNGGSPACTKMQFQGVAITVLMLMAAQKVLTQNETTPSVVEPSSYETEHGEYLDETSSEENTTELSVLVKRPAAEYDVSVYSTPSSTYCPPPVYCARQSPCQVPTPCPEMFCPPAYCPVPTPCPPQSPCPVTTPRPPPAPCPPPSCPPTYCPTCPVTTPSPPPVPCPPPSCPSTYCPPASPCPETYSTPPTYKPVY